MDSRHTGASMDEIQVMLSEKDVICRQSFLYQ